MLVYHVVTDRPMVLGQEIVLDEAHRSGVGRRVQEKEALVEAIYREPEKYRTEELDHHTRVALRELAMEEIRQAQYPQYPSRLACLYVTGSYQEAKFWADYFAGLGRPTYAIVKLEVEGNCFTGDASLCFYGTPDRADNMRQAALYWERRSDDPAHEPLPEMLVDGTIRVAEIVEEVNRNIG